MWRYLLPVAVFAVLVGFLLRGLFLDPQELPSPLIGKSAPAFNLPQLHQAGMNFSPEQMKGRVWMLNVWASWCASCRDENPLFLDLARSGAVPILGLNYKDNPEDAMGWLRQFGNPYTLSVSDILGDVGIDYGVYGVPETFVIDKEGVVRYKHVGPVTGTAWQEKIMPVIKELQG